MKCVKFPESRLGTYLSILWIFLAYHKASLPWRPAAWEIQAYWWVNALPITETQVRSEPTKCIVFLGQVMHMEAKRDFWLLTC